MRSQAVESTPQLQSLPKRTKLAFYSARALKTGSPEQLLLAKMLQAMGASSDTPVFQGVEPWSHPSPPEVLVTLGEDALQQVLQNQSLSELRGKSQSIVRDDYALQVMPTWHPEELIAAPERKRDAWADLQQVQKML